MTTYVPVYPADGGEAIELAPLGADEVTPYTVDWGSSANANPWLETAETILTVTFAAATALAVGDGVTVATTAGGSVTPPAPAIASELTTVYVWNSTGTPGDDTEHLVKCYVKTSTGRIGQQSFKVRVEQR